MKNQCFFAGPPQISGASIQIFGGVRSERNDALQSAMLCFYCNRHGFQGGKVFAANRENFIRIDIEISVGQDVPHALDTGPVYFRIPCEKRTARDFIDFFKTFTDHNEHHGDCVKAVTAFLTCDEIIRACNSFEPPLYPADRLLNLHCHIPDKAAVIHRGPRGQCAVSTMDSCDRSIG